MFGQGEIKSWAFNKSPNRIGFQYQETQEQIQTGLFKRESAYTLFHQNSESVLPAETSLGLKALSLKASQRPSSLITGDFSG